MYYKMFYMFFMDKKSKKQKKPTDSVSMEPRPGK